MKNSVSTGFKTFVCVFTVVFCMFLFPTKVFAKPFFPKKLNYQTFGKNDDGKYEMCGTDVFLFPKGYKISKLKTSNKNVAKITKTTEGKDKICNVYVKKPGKATISFKAKKGNHTYTYKCEITVTKSENYDNYYNNDSGAAKIVLTRNKITVTGTFYDASDKACHFNKKSFKVSSDCIVAYDYPATMYSYGRYCKKNKSMKNTGRYEGYFLYFEIKDNKVIKITHCPIGN